MANMDATQQQQNNAADGDCRSSSGKFANLESAKRDPTNDRAAERRASLVEQSQQTGVLGNLWNSAVRGREPSGSK